MLHETYTGIHTTVTPGTYMMLSVRDTGTGMDEKTMNQIFEPFFSTKHSGKGTGLGLTIVQSIVRQHHGFIDIESEVNKGTTFNIFFPASRVHNHEVPVTEPRQKTRISGKGTVLVAEDDESVRKFLRNLLVKKGYAVVLAGDGEEAIRKYHENMDSIDMLILDVVLPGRNGSEVYDFIKSGRPDIKTLFISGYTDDIITAEGISGENLQFLSKPIDAEELLAIVQENMEGKDNSGRLDCIQQSSHLDRVITKNGGSDEKNIYRFNGWHYYGCAGFDRALICRRKQRQYQCGRAEERKNGSKGGRRKGIGRSEKRKRLRSPRQRKRLWKKQKRILWPE